MKTRQSTEINLLLRACSAEPSASKTAGLELFLEQHSLDWDRLLKLAHYHRVIPLLYRAFREVPSVPDTFLSTLRQECVLITTDNLIKLREYHRVASILDGQKIDHVAFKGVYLAEHSYPERGLRSIGDMDILVDAKDLYKTIGVLAPEGYRVGDKYKPYLYHSAGVIWNELHEISLIKPYFNTGRFDIDLHWRVDCLLKEIGAFELSDFRSSPGFIVEKQVILLVLHHGVTNSWGRIGYINDLYFSLSQADVNWDWLLKKINQCQLKVTFFEGLQWCQQLWKLALPASVQEQMQGYNLTMLNEAQEKRWDKQSIPSFRRATVNFANKQPTSADRVKIYGCYVHSFIFRSSVINLHRRQFYIPKEWGFATAIIRVFLALIRTQ